MNPASVRFQFDFTPVGNPIQPVANAQCLFSRLTIRANNVLLEDIQNYSMCYSVFDYEPMTDGKTYTCSVNLLSGLLLPSKWLWLYATPIDILCKFKMVPSSSVNTEVSRLGP